MGSRVWKLKPYSVSGFWEEFSVRRHEYQTDGVRLLAEALKLTPEEERASLWNGVIAKDPYLQPLKKHEFYLRLKQSYDPRRLEIPLSPQSPSATSP